MSGALTRTHWTLVGLAAVAALVTWAALTAPDRQAPPDFVTESPCGFVFNADASESPFVWVFGGDTRLPSALIDSSSGVVPYCTSGFDTNLAGERNYDLAAYFVFTQDPGSPGAESVWWLFYPAWDDPTEWYEFLWHESGGGDVAIHDGYVVAVSPDASPELRSAALQQPDTDAWAMFVSLNQQP